MGKLNNQALAQIESEYEDAPRYTRRCGYCGAEVLGKVYTIPGGSIACDRCYGEWEVEVDYF